MSSHTFPTSASPSSSTSTSSSAVPKVPSLKRNPHRSIARSAAKKRQRTWTQEHSENKEYLSNDPTGNLTRSQRSILKTINIITNNTPSNNPNNPNNNHSESKTTNKSSMNKGGRLTSWSLSSIPSSSSDASVKKDIVLAHDPKDTANMGTSTAIAPGARRSHRALRTRDYRRRGNNTGDCAPTASTIPSTISATPPLDSNAMTTLNVT
ncbi:hypothetical protein BGZ74_002844, partial [Mortierella antarctica]